MSSHGKILKASALKEADEGKARAELAASSAESMLRKARIEAEAIRSKAREEGLAQGTAEAAALVARAIRIKNDALKESEPVLIELAVAIAHRILDKAISLHPEAAADRAGQVIGLARNAMRFSVHVHPDDAALVTERIRLLIAHRPVEELGVVSDPSVPQGDCIVECELGRLDARLEVVLTKLRQELLGDRS